MFFYKNMDFIESRIVFPPVFKPQYKRKRTAKATKPKTMNPITLISKSDFKFYSLHTHPAQPFEVSHSALDLSEPQSMLKDLNWQD